MATPWYAYNITQAYGQNGEKGVDLGTPFHTPITALFAGTVRFAGRTQWSGGGSSGGEVTIVCNLPGVGPMTSYYLHLDTATVRVGDTVKEGQVIGLSGGQLSGGQWPVVNRGGFFSNGPHTEFGFNAPWVSGPGHQIDPTPYILAARAGTLPNTSPDGTATSTLSSSQGGTPIASVWTPTLVETMVLQSYTLASQTRKVTTQPTGWDGICQAIDYTEQFPDFNWLNPIGSMWADLPPFFIRAMVTMIGLAIIWLAIRAWLTPAAPIVQNLVGRAQVARAGAGGVGTGAAEAGATDAALEAAPVAAAL